MSNFSIITWMDLPERTTGKNNFFSAWQLFWLTEGQTDDRTDERTDKRADGHTDGRTEIWTDRAISIPPLMLMQNIYGICYGGWSCLLRCVANSWPNWIYPLQGRTKSSLSPPLSLSLSLYRYSNYSEYNIYISAKKAKTNFLIT